MWLWPLTSDLDLLHGPHLNHRYWLLKISWWYKEVNIVKICDRRIDKRTDGRTNWTIHRAALSQLKVQTICHARDLRKLAQSCKQLHLIGPLSQFCQALGKFRNALIKTVLSKYSFFKNKGHVHNWNYHKSQYKFVRRKSKYIFSTFGTVNTISYRVDITIKMSS